MCACYTVTDTSEALSPGSYEEAWSAYLSACCEQRYQHAVTRAEHLSNGLHVSLCSQANDAFSMQSEMVAVLSNELKQVSSQLNNVRYAQATAAGTGASNQQQQYIEQQLQVLRGDMHNQVCFYPLCVSPSVAPFLL